MKIIRKHHIFPLPIKEITHAQAVEEFIEAVRMVANNPKTDFSRLRRILLYSELHKALDSDWPACPEIHYDTVQILSRKNFDGIQFQFV